MKSKLLATLVTLALLSTLSHQSTLHAQGTLFTYQGRLNFNGTPANGNYEFEFVLFPTNQTGFPVGPVPFTNVIVNNGLFTVPLDFGSGIFTGTNYWLDIYVRTNGAASFTELSPRQPITPTPYAITAGSVVGNGAGLANVNAATLGGLSSSNFWKVGGNAGASGGFVGTTDNQPFDVRVSNARVVRYQLNTDGEGFYTNAPNVIDGSSLNTTVTTGVVGATIGGGGGNYYTGVSYPNKVTADFGTVSGGRGNTASGDVATVGGGFQNIATNDATVEGGFQNIASGLDSTVGGGESNTAGGENSTVGGGSGNTAITYWATVGGRAGNTASGDYSTVAGGEGNTSSGPISTVSGGYFNIASGEGSFAAGVQAHASHNGSFVWADDNSFNFSSTTANQFRVRATGGVAFATAIDSGSGNVTAGVHLLAGDTAWSSISDKNAKKNFQLVDGEAVLDILATIPVEKWNYKWEVETNTPHIGPMAQDFKAAFYPGRDDKSISTLEFDGVELAAIQGLNQRLNEKDAEIKQLKESVAELKEIVSQLTQTKSK